MPASGIIPITSLRSCRLFHPPPLAYLEMARTPFRSFPLPEDVSTKLPAKVYHLKNTKNLKKTSLWKELGARGGVLVLMFASVAIHPASPLSTAISVCSLAQEKPENLSVATQLMTELGSRGCHRACAREETPYASAYDPGGFTVIRHWCCQTTPSAGGGGAPGHTFTLPLRAVG